MLGVAPNAPAWEVRAAYRDQAKRWHPDAGGDAERFGQVRRAYEVLGDPERRRRYDASLLAATLDEKPGTIWQEMVLPEHEQRPAGRWVLPCLGLVAATLALGLMLRGLIATGLDPGDDYLFGPTYDGAVRPESAGGWLAIVAVVAGLTLLITGLVGLRIALTGPPRRGEVALGLLGLLWMTAAGQIIFAGDRWPGILFFSVVGFVGWTILGVVLERRDFAAFLRSVRSG